MRSTKTNAFVRFSLVITAFIVCPLQLFAAETNVVAGNTAFALDLYKQLNSGDGNLFFSPYSISTCLAMTYAGARGNTELQMARTLHFGTDQTEFHKAFAENEKQLKLIQTKGGPGADPAELCIANGLWAQKAYPFLPAFLNAATNTYAARLELVDFRTAAQPARKEINDWVSDRTKEKINDLIPPGAVNQETRLVLVNAIYFKGNWAEPFKKIRTTDQPFFVPPSEKVQTRMMSGSADYQYSETDTLQLLEMPYAGDWISMAVLLPKEPHRLAMIESSLNQKQLNDWLTAARSRRVNVFLPRFKLTQEFNLSRTLATMGMNDAFSMAANFSGMDGQSDLFISAVIHKAYVDVNEEGTEAAAATGVVMARGERRKPEPVVTFRADHPFLFLIRDTRTGSILFLGRVTDPTK